MNDARDTIRRFLTAARWRVRLRRSLACGALGVTLVWLVAIVPFALTLAGGPPLWWWSTAPLALISAAGFLLASLAAASVPVQSRLVTREADRRLRLDGALLTAVDVLDSTEPIRGLLVRRTAGAIRGARLRQALPVRLPAGALLLPALATAAFAVSTQAPPTGAVAAYETHVAASIPPELSAELQRAAAELLTLDERSPQTVAAARELLRIDVALRGGEAEIETIRQQLAELASRLDAGSAPSAAAPGRAPQQRPAGRAAEIVLSVVRTSGRPGASAATIETAATGAETPGPDGSMPGRAQAAAGRGEGAGLGRAGTGVPPSTDAAGATDEARATWSLPAITGARRGVVPARAGATVSDARAGSAASARLTRAEARLTREERRLVESYFEALDRRRDAADATSPEEQR
jgi:hypothetical protein